MIPVMPTQTENLNRPDSAEATSSNAEGLDWAVFGCLAAGGVGIIKALQMDKPVDILVCLLGSLVAFCVVFYVNLRRP
jgi:hypothetical protein